MILQNESIDNTEKAPFEEGRFTVFALIYKLTIRNLSSPKGLERREVPSKEGLERNSG